MAAVYDPLADFYDLEYGNKDNDLDFYLELAEQIGSPVLEIGTGTGRLALPIAESGSTVVGIDNSLRMLLKAKEKAAGLGENRKIQLVQADMRSFCLKPLFPLCIIPFRAFLHNLTQNDQIATLRCAHRHLQSGGILALDLFVPVYSVMAKIKWQEQLDGEDFADPKGNVSILTTVKHKPAEQLLHVTNVYSRGKGDKKKVVLKSGYSYRYVFRYEMELLLKMAGFKIHDVYGGFDAQPYNFHSGNMIFIAEKINFQ
jgi:SAM-dependent methyltransferase